MTPEQFEVRSFRLWLKDQKVMFVFVDEAHDMVSEAHYRKSFQSIGSLLEILLGPVVRYIFMSGTYPTSFQSANQHRFLTNGKCEVIGKNICPINLEMSFMGSMYETEADLKDEFLNTRINSLIPEICNGWKVLVLVPTIAMIHELYKSCQALQKDKFVFGFFYSLAHEKNESEKDIMMKHKESFVGSDDHSVNILFVTTACCSGIFVFLVSLHCRY